MAVPRGLSHVVSTQVNDTHYSQISTDSNEKKYKTVIHLILT